MKRTKLLIGMTLITAIILSLITVEGVNVELTDEVGRPITTVFPNSKVFVNIWTFDESGGIVNLQGAKLKTDLLFPSSSITVSYDTIRKAKEFAKKKGLRTAFIGIDVAILDEKGKLWTFPPVGFDVPLDLFATLSRPKTVKITLNVEEARVTDLHLPSFERLRYEWRTVKDIGLGYTEILVLIIKKDCDSNVVGVVEICYDRSKLSVAFGHRISDLLKFDPDKIVVKVLDGSKTDYYKAGNTIDLDGHHRWGYVYVEAKPHYIFRKEYLCYQSLHRWVCFETGNEEHIVKIDGFKIDHATGRIKVIKSGSKLEKPLFGIPSSDYAIPTNDLRMYEGGTVQLEEFFDGIYRLGIGIPVGATIKFFKGCEVPQWLDAITVGVDCTGSIENRGPNELVRVHGMKSKYKVSVLNCQIPMGFYVEVLT